MNKILLPFITVIVIAGCAGSKTVTQNYLVDDNDKYIPINLYVDAGRYISTYEASLIKHIYANFAESGLFTNIETAFTRWPITIRIKYSSEQSEGQSGKEFANAMISAATLLLIPTTITEYHTIEATILSGNRVIDTIELTEKIETAMSLYHDPVADRKNGMNRLFAKISHEKLIPTLSDIGQGGKPDKELLL